MSVFMKKFSGMTVIIANKLKIPVDTKVILWDMDGVLIDSLGLDLEVCNDLLQKSFGSRVELSRDYIRSLFAYDVPTLWRTILKKVEKDYDINNAIEFFQELFDEYNKLRQQYKFALNQGIIEILEDAKNKNLKMAVVSNNPVKDVEEVLDNVGLNNRFDLVVGNDLQEMKKKPAPDTYLFASEQLGVEPKDCVVVEDSLIGIKAGRGAGCYVVGVGTGSLISEELEELKKKGEVNEIYLSFAI